MIERPSRERRRHPDKPTKADRNIPPQPYYVVLHLTQITDTSDSQQPRRLKPERLVTGPYDTRDSGAATIGRLTATVGILHPARVPCRQTGIPMGALRTNRELSIERYHIHCKMSSKQKGRSRSGGMALWLEPQRFPRHTLYEDESDTPDQHALRSDLPMHLATVEPFIRHLDPAKNAKWKEDRYVVVHGFTRRQYGLPVRTFVKK